ncbi:hypothetical protein K438DRAFT_2013684 [Mycena galopus ATCC 62051]|nr:hypothetical protein K438DRAFT_2013684 [Mycena galopus ATCC 62051]
MPRTELHELLARELNEAIVLDVPNFIGHVFPDNSLPLPVDALLEALTGIRGSHSMYQQRALRKPDWLWTTFPSVEQDLPETFATQLAVFLNQIGETIREVCRISGGPLPKKKRRWCSTYAAPESLPLSGHCTAEHPALVLFDGKPEEEGWNSALSVAEVVFSDDYDYASSLHRLIHDASDTFFNQDDRRFQISLTFAARTARLVLIDHSGVVASEFFDIDEQPELLVRVVAGLMLSSRPSIGFDTSITMLKNGQRQIKVGPDVYDIVVRLAISHDVRGKATVVWHARRDGVDFVVKDNWTDIRHSHIEAGILDTAKDVPGIAKLVVLETVTINRTKDSTAALRSILNGRSPEIRLHQRMVMTPLARKILHFRSKKELISVFIDAIEAHRSLVGKKILHCDISSNNIMISDEVHCTASFGGPLRRGLLIDVDSALELGNIGYWVGFVGTFVFMSSAVLIHGSSTKQKPSDDLESFFWVLIYLCIRCAGPNNTTRADLNAIIEDCPLFYHDQTQASEIGRYKKQMLSAKGALEREIFPKFSLYCEDLKPCVAELRDVFTKNKNKFVYDAMLDVLRRTRDALPAVEDWSIQSDPVHRLRRSPVVSPAAKRRRGADR